MLHPSFKFFQDYQQYIDYLEDVVIYNLKRVLSEALASPDPSSSAGEDRCCKCSTALVNATRKIGPSTFTTSTPTGYYMSLKHSGGSMLSWQFSYN
jgi:hypothetical protein